MVVFEIKIWRKYMFVFMEGKVVVIIGVVFGIGFECVCILYVVGV